MKILVVENDADDAEFVRQCLQRDNRRRCEITHVSRLDAALIALAATSFDVVLLDLHLPDATGRECVEGVQQAAPQVPIVVLSGQSDEDYAVEILNRGSRTTSSSGKGMAVAS